MSRSPFPHADRELLARISRSAGGKAGYKQLVRELGLGGGRERRLLLEQLTGMVGRGELRKLEGELWAIPRPPVDEAQNGSNSDSHVKATFGAKTASLRWQGFDAASRGSRERLLSGRLELHRDGYGFVRPDPGKQTVLREPGASADIFIPPHALHGAMHGDLVLVDEEAPARDGRRSGRVARVLTRRNPTVVGIFHYARGTGRRRQDSAFEELRGNHVQPFDERLGGLIEIPEGAEVVAAAAESPHRTLGEEAWRVAEVEKQQVPYGNDNQKDKNDGDIIDEPAGRWPLEDLAVEVEITSYPQPGRPARGRVIEVLGPPDAFGVDVEIIIRKHAIPHTFPAHVLAAAEESAGETVASLSPEELTLREDFRGLPIVTIDGETARDFDDAVLVRSLANGNTELQVHIADVGWYVRAGSALDTEARVRGTSVYFPDRAVPMLPHALSSGVCSLLPHEDRPVLSCVMEVDPHGEIVGYRVGEGLIRSVRRMTYTSVQRCLNASPAAAEWNGLKVVAESEDKQVPSHSTALRANDNQKNNSNSNSNSNITPEPSAEDLAERERIGLEQPELPEAFDRMLELALRLNRKRARRGSIDFDLPEPVVEFDPDGNMKAIVRSERGWAHRLIEEFMLSANECVATWLTAQGIASIYRIHEMPDPKRIVEFEETAAGFGQTLGIGALQVKRLTMKSDRREAQRNAAKGRSGRTPQSHELPERIPVTPQMYQKLVRRIQGTPEERILAYLMLRSLKQARYSEKNEGHFALASPCYTHFTSPIRRYPDLIVHRLLRIMLRRGADPRGGPILSNDPQPWAAELARSQGKHAVYVSRTHDAASVPPQARVREPGAPVAVLAPGNAGGRGKRPGRIGWSEGTEPAARFAGSARDDAGGTEDNSRFPSGMTPKKMLSEGNVNGEKEAIPFAEPSEPSTAAEPISAEELADIAVESSQAERRAAEAERELIEWKKLKFMANRIGDDFSAIILSVTKYGFFVELDELFIEGLVPLGSLQGDFYSFRDTDRMICGARTGHCFHVGERVEVILDRIDRQQRRLQFALTPGTEPMATAGASSIRAGKSEAKKARAEARKQAKEASGAKGKAAKKTKSSKRNKR